MRTVVLSIVVFIVFAAKVNAQNTKEVIQDHTQISVGKKSLERDSEELETFKNDCDVLKQALGSQDNARITKYRNKVLASMQREVAQANSKTKRAGKEVMQSSAEKSTNRREKRRNRRSYVGTTDDRRDMARDRRNTRDDRRDKRDDQADLSEVKQRRDNQQAWTENFTNLDLLNAENSDTANTIMTKFTASMVADIQQTKSELLEDKGELREDRRERRDDRRERKETVGQH